MYKNRQRLTWHEDVLIVVRNKTDVDTWKWYVPESVEKCSFHRFGIINEEESDIQASGTVLRWVSWWVERRVTQFWVDFHWQWDFCGRVCMVQMESDVKRTSPKFMLVLQLEGGREERDIVWGWELWWTGHSSHCLEGRCEDVTGLFLNCNKVEINWGSAWIVSSWSLDLQESNNLGRRISEQLNNVTKDHASYFSSFRPLSLPLALSHLAWYKAQDCQRLVCWDPWVRVPCKSEHKRCRVWTTA